VYSLIGAPAFCDPASVRSSTSVKFITWRTFHFMWCLKARRSTSQQTKVRKLPMWARL
jgi:hypothetical protein